MDWIDQVQQVSRELGVMEMLLLGKSTARRYQLTREYVLGGEAPKWFFPIGTDKYPVKDWYVATVHDLTGVLNDGYRHSGVDYNLDKAPWGHVDLGLPVWAIADGVVHGTWHSVRNLGSVVIMVLHEGQPLWVRYWHLAYDATFLALRPGVEVSVGQCLGHLGKYRNAAHLHFDMATTEFHPGCWLVPQVAWVDPVPILKAHLDPDLVVASLCKQ